MKSIPTHRALEVFDGYNAFLRRVVGRVPHSDTMGIHKATRTPVDYAPRDEYYIFFLVKDGKGKVIIDFEEYEFRANTIHCIMPGQVHHPARDIYVDGWLLAVDSLLVRSEYRKILEKKTCSKTMTVVSRQKIEELEACLTLIYQRFKYNEQPTERSVLTDLISAYIGMVADIYQKEIPASLNNRAAEITLQFKALLLENHRTMNRPAQYAERMNLSLVYLNEVVKKTAGLSVSQCIRNEIVLQAKRLLYYTNLTIKDISLMLGYEDWAYFTRMFTKAAGCSPSQFRKENLDSSNSNI